MARGLICGAGLLAMGCLASFPEADLCTPETEGDACGEGRCRGGDCCAGCFDETSQTCMPGDQVSACGRAGAPCAACSSGACSEGRCEGRLPAIGVGGFTSYTIAANGALYGWGSTDSGQVVEPPTGSRSVPPTRIGTQLGWTTIDAGWPEQGHACGIRDGALHCWGHNGSFELGTGDELSSSTPMLIDDGSEAPWTSLGLGRAASCAIRAPGALFCWGWTRPESYLLVPPSAADDIGGHVHRPRSVSSDEDWLQVRLGDAHGCGLRAGGRLHCWGANTYSQVGLPGPDPVGITDLGEGFAAVDAGLEHTCALRADGQVWCWGDNSRGQCGQPAELAEVSTPTRVGSEPQRWTAVAAGGQHTCAIDATGRAFCWGSNTDGQLGIGTPELGATVREPREVDANARFRRIETGVEHTCALTEEDEVWCWGSASNRQNGAPLDRASPERVEL